MRRGRKARVRVRWVKGGRKKRERKKVRGKWVGERGKEREESERDDKEKYGRSVKVLEVVRGEGGKRRKEN